MLGITAAQSVIQCRDEEGFFKFSLVYNSDVTDEQMEEMLNQISDAVRERQDVALGS